MPVIDLKARLGSRDESAPATRYLVVTRDDELFALLVGDVRQVVSLSEQEVEPSPTMLARSEAEFIYGIGRSRGAPDRLLILLDLDAILRFDLRPAAAAGAPQRREVAR
jgi:chemotaxis signal transduction protein